MLTPEWDGRVLSRLRTNLIDRRRIGDGQAIIKKASKLERRVGREAEGGGLLNRYRALKLYRGFESLTLRQ